VLLILPRTVLELYSTKVLSAQYFTAKQTAGRHSFSWRSQFVRVAGDPDSGQCGRDVRPHANRLEWIYEIGYRLLFLSHPISDYSYSHMDRNEILSSIDSEIERLQQARAAIAGLSAPKRRGRPAVSASLPTSAPKKRILSAAARKRIAAAQRKRWAAQKAAIKAPAKRTTPKKQTRIAKKAAKEVAIKRIPPQKQRERKARAPKNASPTNALSGQSGVVAVPKHGASS
jgi:hypothetical protein